ncbi:hypothetical protein CHUAL_006564 [Chamberlinius hualienensis]
MLGGISRTLVKNAVAIKPTFNIPVRNAHYASGPPKHRIPLWEKGIHGAIIVCSILSIPYWIVYYLMCSKLSSSIKNLPMV